MAIMTNELYLTSKQVMERLQIGKTKLFELIKEGIISPIKLGIKKGDGRGPALKFKKSDIENFVKSEVI